MRPRRLCPDVRARCAGIADGNRSLRRAPRTCVVAARWQCNAVTPVLPCHNEEHFIQDLSMDNAPPTIFISYSHKDEEWKDRLVTQLGVLARQGMLEIWDDRKIQVGADWRSEIANAIQKAKVAILLISANSLTSAFILDE